MSLLVKQVKIVGLIIRWNSTCSLRKISINRSILFFSLSLVIHICVYIHRYFSHIFCFTLQLEQAALIVSIVRMSFQSSKSKNVHTDYSFLFSLHCCSTSYSNVFHSLRKKRRNDSTLEERYKTIIHLSPYTHTHTHTRSQTSFISGTLMNRQSDQ